MRVVKKNNRKKTDNFKKKTKCHKRKNVYILRH